MAKLNALQLLNIILENIGEPTVSALTGLSGIELLAWNKLTESLDEICTDQNTRWDFLESLGVIPMVTGSYQYTITSLSTGSDLLQEDRESFRQSDTGRNLTYKTPQEFDAMYPKGITTDRTGYPDFFTKYAGKFVLDNQATTTQNGKNVDFRYWKRPTQYSTDTSTGTSEFPEGFDKTVLAAIATMKVLSYLGSDEVSNYKVLIYGDGRDLEGSLDKMKRLHSSPLLKAKSTYVF